MRGRAHKGYSRGHAQRTGFLRLIMHISKGGCARVLVNVENVNPQEMPKLTHLSAIRQRGRGFGYYSPRKAMFGNAGEVKTAFANHGTGELPGRPTTLRCDQLKWMRIREILCLPIKKSLPSSRNIF
jgi:hypothetical protein